MSARQLSQPKVACSDDRIEQRGATEGFVTLRSNNLTAREWCPVCGNSHRDAGQPFWVFAYATREAATTERRNDYLGALCGRCAGECAPWHTESARALSWLARGVDVDWELLKPIHEILMQEPPVDLSEPRTQTPW